MIELFDDKITYEQIMQQILAKNIDGFNKSF